MAHGGERKIRRGSSGLETDFRVCRVVRVGESLVYYRAPTKETLPRTTPEDSSSHRISLVQELDEEDLNLPTDNFPLNTAGKNGRPLVTIRPLLFLYLSLYLSHCLSSILMDSFERVWRESPILKRDEGFPSRYEIIFFPFCAIWRRTMVRISFCRLNFSCILLIFRIRSSKSKIIFFIGKIWNKT